MFAPALVLPRWPGLPGAGKEPGIFSGSPLPWYPWRSGKEGLILKKQKEHSVVFSYFNKSFLSCKTEVAIRDGDNAKSQNRDHDEIQ